MNQFTVLDLLDLDVKERNSLKLRCLAGRSGLSRIITVPLISRPGLPLSGFYGDFRMDTIQLLGSGEYSYIKELEKIGKTDTLEHIFASSAPCFIMTGGKMPSALLTDLANENAVPILSTELNTIDFTRHAYAMLEEVFAKTQVIHGVLMEVFGLGILITGESGIGKSETALELIERGHRLIADDSVQLKNISDSYIIGQGPNPDIAHHMELRGIGIINVTDIYGIGAIREKKQVQLCVHLETWQEGKNYDRVGETSYTKEYLGIRIPYITIPIRTGRNVPLLIETAARNERLKKLGYYSAKEFDTSVKEWLESESTKHRYYNTDIGEEETNG